MRDTSPEAEERYYELLRAQPPAQRLAIAMRLTRAVRALAESSILATHPDISSAELKTRLTVRLYGREAAANLFGNVPEDAV